MPLKNLIALGAGEITPELGERDNLLKFKTGLKTARNIRTTKFGGARSREGFIVHRLRLLKITSLLTGQ
jgi:hypothetical protein